MTNIDLRSLYQRTESVRIRYFRSHGVINFSPEAWIALTPISTNLGYYRNRHADWEYRTNVPNSIRHGVSDELGLQTMGCDFNAKDLVAKLIEMFVE